MLDGKLIQNLDPLHVPSKRRNPLLADFFNRLDLMERRGSGMKKIVSAYKQYEQMPTYRAPEFRSDATEFHVVLWNLNYGNEVVKDGADYTNTTVKFTNEFTKEYRKAQRQIYRLISSNPKITIREMAEKNGRI
ncbi:MAG: ATP-binding protein [Prevotella sp.]|uniref:ATP-binding protein n=1 Tax=Prevotella sp. TaxID=59823 RepID=UPI002A297463|nr:ATP-binding protein [Prevotella sp.]MDD7317262.1 ATP-binding protein [Prevotellaceae bacterium]MDY4019866.1 ATP-binding protein [Prevotella sp.]